MEGEKGGVGVRVGSEQEGGCGRGLKMGREGEGGGEGI